jgi:hypothetical protein
MIVKSTVDQRSKALDVAEAATHCSNNAFACHAIASSQDQRVRRAHTGASEHMGWYKIVHRIGDKEQVYPTTGPKHIE